MTSGLRSSFLTDTYCRRAVFAVPGPARRNVVVTVESCLHFLNVTAFSREKSEPAPRVPVCRFLGPASKRASS